MVPASRPHHGLQQVVPGDGSTAGRITGRLLSEAFKDVTRTLSDVFLVAANDDASEWQFVYPTSRGGCEVLRRMTLQRGRPYRTVVEQLAAVYWKIARGGDPNYLHALWHDYETTPETERAGATRFANVIDLDFLYAEGINHFVARVGEDLPAAQFHGSTWALVSTNDATIRRKMDVTGIPLREYVDGKICWGIKTGYNDAFWIDAATRARLIASDPKSVEVIKPLLVGDDIRRYEVHDRHRFILYLPHGINIDHYPSIRQYLRPFRARLEARATNQPWYELQQPQEAYVPIFESEKIAYPDIGQESRFARDSGSYLGNASFAMPLTDECLLGILNPKPIWWYMRGIASAIQGESFRFFRQYVEVVPIPELSSSESSALAQLV